MSLGSRNWKKNRTLLWDLHWGFKVWEKWREIFIDFEPKPNITNWYFTIWNLFSWGVDNFCAFFNVFSWMTLRFCNLSPPFNKQNHHNRYLILINCSATIKVINAKYESNLIIVVWKRHNSHSCNNLIKTLKTLLLLCLFASGRLDQIIKLVLPRAELLLPIVFKLCQISKYEISIRLIEPKQLSKFIFVDKQRVVFLAMFLNNRSQITQRPLNYWTYSAAKV